MLDNTISRKIVALIIIGLLAPILLYVLSGFLPSSLPAEAISSIGTILNEIKKWDFLLPLSTLIEIIVLVFSIEIALLSLNLILLVWAWLKKAE